MAREVKPIADDELAGLIMALTAEAQRAGWSCRYGIQGDGSLVLHVRHPRKSFSMVTADNGSMSAGGRSGRMVIVEKVTAEVTAAQQTPAGDLPPSWEGK